MQNTHIPFHQKYRPKNLDELVGQDFISTTLKQALLSKKIAPAYLFNGPRGTGKTSSARILAKSLNCLSFDQPTINPCGKCELCRQISDGNALDIIEIDAASNTGVENIREIIERARFSPSQARWKVYVIDECHMLSTAASNALLKTIEEPPAKVVFILATTNPERVLTTIQSRCQKFDFRRISSDAIFHHLCQIANKESIKFQDQALKLISKRSQGGMRDAQSLLDQLSLLPEGINTQNVQNLLGEISEIDLINLVNSLIDNNAESLLISCNKLYDAGNEPNQIIIGLLNITRDLLLHSINNTYSDLYYTSIEFQSELNKFANSLEKTKIIEWHNKLKNVEYQIKTSDNPRLWLEVHLTSLLEKQNIESNTKNLIKQNFDTQSDSVNINNHELIHKKNISNNIPNQRESENIANQKLINDVKISNKLPNQSQKACLDEVEFVNNANISKDIQKDNESGDLKEKWELILSKLELPSTRMLLSQQAELVKIDSGEIEIALSPNWENMIKSRKVIIENAVKKIFGEQTKLNFSRKEVKKSNLKEKINESQSKKTIETTKPDLTENRSPKETYNNTSENLAKFFNGEIIDLDE